MVHSMTAFARVESAGTQGTLSWELRSVNSRYLEPHLRLPEAFRDLEGAVREALRQGLSRGKVECTLRFVEEGAGQRLQVDEARTRQLLAAARPLGGDQLAAHVVAQVDHRDREPALRSGAHVNDAAQPDIGGFRVGGVAVQVSLGQRLCNVPLDAGQLLGSAGHIDGMVADQVVLGQLDALQVGDGVVHLHTPHLPAVYSFGCR